MCPHQSATGSISARPPFESSIWVQPLAYLCDPSSKPSIGRSLRVPSKQKGPDLARRSFPCGAESTQTQTWPWAFMTTTSAYNTKRTELLMVWYCCIHQCFVTQGRLQVLVREYILTTNNSIGRDHCVRRAARIAPDAQRASPSTQEAALLASSSVVTIF